MMIEQLLDAEDLQLNGFLILKFFYSNYACGMSEMYIFFKTSRSIKRINFHNIAVRARNWRYLLMEVERSMDYRMATMKNENRKAMNQMRSNLAGN